MCCLKQVPASSVQVPACFETGACLPNIQTEFAISNVWNKVHACFDRWGAIPNK